jgi:hypothetical protein
MGVVEKHVGYEKEANPLFPHSAPRLLARPEPDVLHYGYGRDLGTR